MALVEGNAKTGVAGLAKRIFDNWSADPDAGFSNPLSSAQQLSLGAMCNAIAKSIIDEFHANSQVQITTSDSGLQRDNTGGNPATLAPTSTKTTVVGAVR